MPLEQALKILSELKHLGIKGIVFKGGGEPSLHPQFDQLLAQANALGFEVGVVSNGSLLSCWAEALAEHAAYCRISIDGPTAESHRLIHGVKGALPKIEAGIRALVAARGARSHPFLGLSFAMDLRTLPLAPQAVEMGERLGVDYLLFRPPFFEEVGHKSSMSPAEAAQVRQAFEVLARAQQGPLQILVDHWISDLEVAGGLPEAQSSPRRGCAIALGANGIEHSTGRCLAAPLLAVITADSQIYPCCNLRALPAWSLGKIDYGEGQSFESIWAGESRALKMAAVQQIKCIKHCTHPLSKYNEIIEYLRGPHPHGGFL